MLHHPRLPPLLLVVVGALLVVAAVVAAGVLGAGTDEGWPAWARVASQLAVAGVLGTGSWWAAVGWHRRSTARPPQPADFAAAPPAGGDRQ